MTLYTECYLCNSENYEKGLISILCPTRERPENVVRLISSALDTANNPELLEFLFYVDQDDASFPSQIVKMISTKVKVVSGPKQWISNCHNSLYTKSSGEFLMTAGDDMVFLSDGWDSAIRTTFEEIDDRIGLVFGNDMATHAGKIAVHGFFHRHWIHSVGTWVQPGRGALWDLWSTENAKIIGRLFYLESIKIEHVHYRQGKGRAIFDSTYQSIYTSNSMFRPELTYKKLERERRIDRLLLRAAMNTPVAIEKKYYLSERLQVLLKSQHARTHLLTFSNWELIKWIPQSILRKVSNFIRIDRTDKP